MAIKQSVIEDFELNDGTTVYVQAGQMGGISLSFDGANNQFMQRLTFVEADQLINKLKQVIDEALEARKDG